MRRNGNLYTYDAMVGEPSEPAARDALCLRYGQVQYNQGMRWRRILGGRDRFISEAGWLPRRSARTLWRRTGNYAWGSVVVLPVGVR